jgi:hypothetical protein
MGMVSTIERDWICKDGVHSFPYKELPNWYGIPDIGFIWHNEWEDPEIEYKGKRHDSVLIEDTMWAMYKEECKEDVIESSEDGFGEYMRNNKEEIYALIELIE